jgi:hypothetical protein
MTNMNKHIVNEHGATLNGYKEQKRNNNEESGCQQKGKKRKTMPPHFITKLFLTKTFTNQMIQVKRFIKFSNSIDYKRVHALIFY